MTPDSEDTREAARDRTAILWCAVAFALVGVAGLKLVPAGRWIWLAVIVAALTAIPQAFVSTRKARRGRR
jgi:Flp pilus assembly protein TadB